MACFLELLHLSISFFSTSLLFPSHNDHKVCLLSEKVVRLCDTQRRAHGLIAWADELTVVTSLHVCPSLSLSQTATEGLKTYTKTEWGSDECSPAIKFVFWANIGAFSNDNNDGLCSPTCREESRSRLAFLLVPSFGVQRVTMPYCYPFCLFLLNVGVLILQSRDSH